MTSSQQAVALLEEIHDLMQLAGENPFKVRAFEKAQAAVAEQEDLADRAKAGTLTELPGIGKGISEVLTEFLLHGTSRVRDELKASLPPGLLELTQIPGLGPKKAQQIIAELGIETVRELEYACKENRLLKLKGFGVKAQQKILESIQFLHSTEGQQRLDQVFEYSGELLKVLEKAAHARVAVTGALRRRMEVLSAIEYLVEAPEQKALRLKQQEATEHALEKFRKENPGALPATLNFATSEVWGFELARTTASEAHWKALEKFGAKKWEKAKAAAGPTIGATLDDAGGDEAFYEALGLSAIAPEMRETGEEIALAQKGSLSDVLAWNGVQGVFHNHTNRSDGSATLDEMVVAAKKLGFKYIGISDHSQTAFYAQGLKEDTLKEQEREIREVQEKHPEIRVFWGIESDILQDGSLDYPEKVLKRFDFVVASIHQRFKLDRESMTDRIVAAIRNPHTRFIGHLTGRLLLGRKGYEIDVEKIIQEAARHDVAIEINAHPLRLDIDWRWGPALRAHNALVSVNPDAHEVAGLKDVVYGIGVARKALLPTSLVVNSRSTAEVEKWLKRR